MITEEASGCMEEYDEIGVIELEELSKYGS